MSVGPLSCSKRRCVCLSCRESRGASVSEVIDWNSLSPERRDTLIAEKIMRWHPEECKPESYQVVANLDSYRCYKCGKHAPIESGYYYHLQKTPRYSTSMDAAWLIVERMTQLREPVYGSPFRIFTMELRNQADRHLHESDWIYNFFLSLTPEAICIAALRACGIEVQP
jgi:Phage ABA sandwich domain